MQDNTQFKLQCKNPRSFGDPLNKYFDRTYLQSLKMPSVIEIIYASTESFVITNMIHG